MVDCGIVEASPVRFLGSIDVPDSDMIAQEAKIHSKFYGRWRNKDDYFFCSDAIMNYIRCNCHTKCKEMNEYIKVRWGRCRRAKRLQLLERKI